MIIHPTAIIDPQAEIDDSVKIAPYAVIDGPVRIGPETTIGAHTVVSGHTTIGARNTIEYSAGLEYVRNARRRDQLPLRLGIRSVQLPFLLVQGSQPKELGISAGTALRFANNLAGLDLTLERVRRTQGDAYRENAWLFSVGISVRSGQASPLR